MQILEVLEICTSYGLNVAQKSAATTLKKTGQNIEEQRTPTFFCIGSFFTAKWMSTSPWMDTRHFTLMDELIEIL